VTGQNTSVVVVVIIVVVIVIFVVVVVVASMATARFGHNVEINKIRLLTS